MIEHQGPPGKRAFAFSAKARVFPVEYRQSDRCAGDADFESARSTAGPGACAAPDPDHPAEGIFYGSVSEIFGQSLSVSSGYIDGQVIAGDGVVIRFPDSKSVVGLNAVSGGAQNQSWSAQLAANDQYFTNLKLINTGTQSRNVTLRAMNESGSGIAPSVTVDLSVGANIEQDVV